jgi:hypothetical protein
MSKKVGGGAQPKLVQGESFCLTAHWNNLIRKMYTYSDILFKMFSVLITYRLQFDKNFNGMYTYIISV